MARRFGVLLVVFAVVAFTYPVVSALVGVAPVYNHPISAKLLYGYYFKSQRKNLPGYFFRFTSKFIHDGDEEMVFDTVVARNTQITLAVGLVLCSPYAVVACKKNSGRV